MPLFARYLTRLFAVRFALLLAGLTALVALLDLMAHGGAVAAGEGAGGLWRYAGLRLPLIVSRLLPFTVLIAALLTLTGMARHRELIVLIGAGVSQFGLMVAFLPALVAIAAVHFWLDDRVAPAAIAELRAWQAAGYGAGEALPGGAAVWLRQGTDVIRLKGVQAPGKERLAGVTIFRRDAEGILVERIDAASAVLEGGGWVLHGVARFDVASNTVANQARLAWDGDLRPSLAASLAAHPRELSFAQVGALAAATGQGNRPLYLYQVWLNRKLVAPLASLLMVLFAVPLGQRFERRGGAATIAAGVAIGFCFFVFDGFTLVVGEAGLLPPWIAAWAPTLAFAAIGGAMAFHAERR
jgi:lipopolysaccharide export system permease protein